MIEELTQANIRSVMLTGDNMYTAISVARVCGIIRPADRVSIIHADAMGVCLEAATIEATDPKAVNVSITVLCSALVVFYSYRENCAFSFLSDFIFVSDDFCIYTRTLFSTEVAVKFFVVAKLRSRKGHIFQGGFRSHRRNDADHSQASSAAHATGQHDLIIVIRSVSVCVGFEVFIVFFLRYHY